ncbi:hypothetical protein ACH4C2_15445 [Streptomyces sp. NPDC018057]|uniref:hypothetical protein n=1 Tax=unclassified Streptomyces TaxID=2593676 RepID=UPI00379DAC2A
MGRVAHEKAGNGPAARAARAGAVAATERAAHVAERHGFGAHRATRALGGGDVGCAGFGAAVVLLAPGIGLTAGSHGTAVTALGAAFLALAVALPLAALRHERHRDGRLPRMHAFDGGLVLTGRTDADAHPWRDIRVVERAETTTVGQGGNRMTVQRIRFQHVDGRVLCSMAADTTTVEIARVALAGGAHT